MTTPPPFFLSALDLPSLTSRAHPLNTFKSDTWKGFVKRDDELSFGVSGCKARKYASLLPYLETHAIEEVIVIGGAFSNNVLGICQRLIEKKMRPTLFLRGDKSTPLKGNFLLTSLLIPETSIHWISRQEWPRVKQLASKYAEKQQTKELNCYVLEEGASVEPSLAGALTLGWDIINNENSLQISFDHIFIDSGTSLSAIGLLLYFAWVQKTTPIHIILLAGDPNYFNSQLARFKKSFEKSHYFNLEKLPPYYLYQPKEGCSFGSVTRTTFETVREIANKEGFFVDPIYSAKLFSEAKTIVNTRKLKGNILLIHSGGAITLSGFQDQLIRSIQG